MTGRVWTDYVARANYYWILDLDAALDPVADKDELISLIESAETDKAEGTRSLLLKALKDKMLNDLTVVDNLHVWQAFRADFSASLNSRPIMMRHAANTIFDILGETEIDEMIAKDIAKEIGDMAVFDEVARARKIVTVKKAHVEVSIEFKNVCSKARKAVTKLLPYLQAHSVQDVYQLLSLSTGLSVSAASTDMDVNEAIKTLQDAPKRAGGHNISKWGAVNEIASSLGEVFRASRSSGAVSARKVFDDLLKLELALPFFSTLQLFRKYGAVRLDHVERLAAKGSAATGLSPERVLELTRAVFEDEKALLGIWVPTAHFRACGACGAINLASETACAACQSDLYTNCANCDRRFDSASTTCPICGLIRADGESGRTALSQAALALDRNDMDYAKRAISKASRLLPRSQDLADLNARLTQLRDSAKAHEARLTRLVTSERRMCEALRALSELPLGFNSSLAERLRLDAERALAGAENKIATARKQLVSGNSEAAELEVQAALALVVDHIPSLSLQAKIPPPPPSQAEARCRDRTVVLDWKCPNISLEGLEFVVVRTIGGASNTVNEDNVIARTSAFSYTDTDPRFGAPLFYAVFSLRGEVYSLLPVTAKEVMVLAAVTDLKPQADESNVRLSWCLPCGANNAEIHRVDPQVQRWQVSSSKALAHAHDRFVDESARKGLTYRYHVLACYILPDGSVRRSISQSVIARIIEPPSTIAEFHLTDNDEMLRWSPPVRQSEEDEVLLFENSAKTISAQPNTLVDRADITELGYARTVIVSVQNAHFPVAKLPFGRYRLMVCRTHDGQTRIGPTLDMVHLTPPSDVKLDISENGAKLSWRWPDGCQLARVRMLTGGTMREVYVTGTLGVSTASHDIAVEPPAKITTIITAAIDRSGLESESVTHTVQVLRRNRLKYSVTERRNGIFGTGGRETILDISFDLTEQLPKLEIRFHPSHKPSAGEGECIKIVEALNNLTDRHEENITAQIDGRKGFIGIVLSEPALRQRIDIVPINARLP